MAALSAQRNTPMMQDRLRLVVGVEKATKIYLGAMVALDDNDFAVPAQAKGSAPVSNLPKVLGRCEMVHNGIPGQDADNTAGTAGGEISIVVRRGVFKWDNDGSIVKGDT